MDEQRIDDVRHDARRLREGIQQDISDFLIDHPDVTIEYGSIYIVKNKKGKRVKVRLDFKLKK